MLELLDMIERGFDDIEHRISNMDKEHSKYVRATVTRLNYLLSGESDTKGLVIQLLNRMSEDDYEEVIQKTGEKMNLSLVEILSEKSLYFCTMITCSAVVYGSVKSTLFLRSSVTVIPAAPKSALPDCTAGRMESNSISSIFSSYPSLSQIA